MINRSSYIFYQHYSHFAYTLSPQDLAKARRRFERAFVLRGPASFIEESTVDSARRPKDCHDDKCEKHRIAATKPSAAYVAESEQRALSFHGATERRLRLLIGDATARENRTCIKVSVCVRSSQGPSSDGDAQHGLTHCTNRRPLGCAR